jgi:isocitrate lyase
MAFAASVDDKRWEGVSRLYTKQDVEKLRGSMKIEHTLARQGAERLWKLLHTEPYIHALGALTGNQAVQQVQGECLTGCCHWPYVLSCRVLVTLSHCRNRLQPQQTSAAACQCFIEYIL